MAFRNSIEMNSTTQREDNNFLILIVTHATVIIRSFNSKHLNFYQLQVDFCNQRDLYIEKSDWSSQRKLFRLEIATLDFIRCKGY